MKVIFSRFIMPIIIIAGGILFVVLGFGQNKNVETFKDVTATITDIQVDYGVGDESDEYEVVVRYTVDGKDYTQKIDSYKSSYKIGDEISIKYNPDNPTEVTAMTKGGVTLYIAIGAVAALAGLVMLIRGFLGMSTGTVTTRSGPVEDYDLKM